MIDNQYFVDFLRKLNFVFARTQKRLGTDKYDVVDAMRFLRSIDDPLLDIMIDSMEDLSFVMNAYVEYANTATKDYEENGSIQWACESSEHKYLAILPEHKAKKIGLGLN